MSGSFNLTSPTLASRRDTTLRGGIERAVSMNNTTKEKAKKALKENPKMSFRELAELTGISAMELMKVHDEMLER